MIPNKLTDDAIVEAMCQIQFSIGKEVPEVILGRLSDLPEYTLTRLPFAEVPAIVRQQNPSLHRQPLLELKRKNEVIRIGESVLSSHVVGIGSYPGWASFQPMLAAMFSRLFEKVSGVEISNISLRYINAITKPRHFLGDVHDLELEMAVGGVKFSGPMNLSFSEELSDRYVHVVTTRIAHPSFVQGSLPTGTGVIVDVEVSTQSGFRTKSIDDALSWLNEAHTLEKKAFFKLIPKDALAKLVKE